MIENNILINTKDKELTVEHLYTVEGYFTFNIKIRSGEFAGASNFCMPKERIISIVETLSEMHKELKGRCEINDSDSDAFIIIEMDKLGHMCIYGQIGGSHEDHIMKFKFTTDQTVLIGAIQMFKEFS